MTAIAVFTWAVALAATDPPREQKFTAGQPLPEGLRLAGGTPAPAPSTTNAEQPIEQAAPPSAEREQAPARPDAPPPYKPTDRAKRPPIARGPFYVTSLDAGSVSYSIARYSNGFPDPPGLVVAHKFQNVPACFTYPSVTRDAGGTYYLYALQRRCDADRITEIVAYTSRDGKKFSRRGTALKAPGFGSAYFVYDNGVFRAWYLRVKGRKTGLHYAESRDGLHFREVGAVPAPDGQIDSVIRDGQTWYALMQGGPTRRPDEPFLATFRDPRELRFHSVRYLARARRISTRLAQRAQRGSRAVITTGTGRLRRGDLIVLQRAADAPGYDTVQIDAVDGDTLRLRTALSGSYLPGDEIRVADRRRLAPSYVCRAADGSWRGAFSTSRAFVRLTAEVTVAYRARSLRGPWEPDRDAAAPLLTLENQQLTRSVTQPTPVTTSPDVQTCP